QLCALAFCTCSSLSRLFMSNRRALSSGVISAPLGSFSYPRFTEADDVNSQRRERQPAHSTLRRGVCWLGGDPPRHHDNPDPSRRQPSGGERTLRPPVVEPRRGLTCTRAAISLGAVVRRSSLGHPPCARAARSFDGCPA